MKNNKFFNSSKFEHVKDLIKDLEIGKSLICTPNITTNNLRKHLFKLNTLEYIFILSTINKNNTYRIIKRSRIKNKIKPKEIKYNYRISIPKFGNSGYRFDIKELKKIRNDNNN